MARFEVFMYDRDEDSATRPKPNLCSDHGIADQVLAAGQPPATPVQRRGSVGEIIYGDYSNVVGIRACGGHSQFRWGGDLESKGWTRVDSSRIPRVWHGTSLDARAGVE
eukprot:3481022-Pyramimonas_sp.AAC.1